MKTYKQVKKKVIDQIICDCCGQSCTMNEPFDEHEYATLEATWGYFSNQDGTQYNIELCESCFNDVLQIIKHKRKKHLGPFNYPYESDPLDGKSYYF